jgi:hypothetical protein
MFRNLTDAYALLAKDVDKQQKAEVQAKRPCAVRSLLSYLATHEPALTP